MPSEYPISLVIKAIDKVTAPLKKINAQVQKISEPTKRLNNAFHSLAMEAGFGKLIDRSQRLCSSISDVAKESFSLGKHLAEVGTVAGVALLGLAKTTAEAGDQISKTAGRLGVGTKKLQEWRFAAEQSGVSQDTLDESLQHLGIRLAQAVGGMGDARDILNAMGVRFKNAKGHVRSLEDVLPDLADKFSKIKNASVRNAIAFKLFGAEGVGLIAMLQGGSKGLASMVTQSQALGAVMSDDAITAAVKFKDAWDRLKTTFGGLRTSIGALLLPLITDWMEKLQGFLIENRAVIVQWSKEFIAHLPETLSKAKEAFIAFKDALYPVMVVAQKAVELLGGIKGVAVAVAVILGGKLILSVLALANAFKNLLLVFLSNPILAIITAIAVGAFLVIRNWDKVKATVLEVMDKIKAGISAGVEFIESTIERVFSAIKDFLNQLNPFEAIHNGIEKAQDLLSHFKFSKSSELPAPSNGVWEPSWGATHMIRQLSQERNSKAQANVKVVFENAPRGMRVETSPSQGVDVDTYMGIQMAN